MSENQDHAARFVQITRLDRVDETKFYEEIYAMHDLIWQGLMPPQFPHASLTVKRERNVIMPPRAAVPDCVTCGVCCAAMLCVGVRPGEETKLPREIYWDVTAGEEPDAPVVDRYLRRDPETLICAQLDVTDGRTTCRIYEDRPRMCRDFDAGSDKCHALRRAYGIEPFLDSEQFFEASERLEKRPPRFDLPTTIAKARFRPKGDGRLEIEAEMMDGERRVIHEFDPRQTTFMQFEFDALPIDDALKLIAARETK